MRERIARDGEDVVFSSQIGTSKPSEKNYRIRCDGRFHPVPFGYLSCKYDAPNLIEGETRGLDKQTDYWTSRGVGRRAGAEGFGVQRCWKDEAQVDLDPRSCEIESIQKESTFPEK